VRRLLTPLTGAVVLAASLAACSSTPSSQATFSCKAVPDEDYPPNYVASVTMTTTAFLNAGFIGVRVINFNSAGGQIGTDVLAFNGPFASGQVFTDQRTVADPVASCDITEVSADGGLFQFTYTNENPAS